MQEKAIHHRDHLGTQIDPPCLVLSMVKGFRTAISWQAPSDLSSAAWR